MLTAEQNDRLTRVGPGTPTGELMRRYWHPIAAVSQMNDRSTKPIKLLGEELILYKDNSGTYGLVDNYCPHRRMGMVYGIPTDDGIRCPYHGWMFNETGACLEQPYEATEAPDNKYKDKVKIKAYPLQVKAGLIFAYMGPSPAPLLPNWDVFAIDNVVRDIGYTELPCNWLQCQENSLDPVHSEWLHGEWGNYIATVMGTGKNLRPRYENERIGFDKFQYGIIKRRLVKGGGYEDPEWAQGHPIVFPYFLRQGGSGIAIDTWKNPDDTPGIARGVGPSFQIRVPIDDTHTGHWWVMCHPKANIGDPDQKHEDVPFFEPPLINLKKDGRVHFEILDSNSAQDVAAWATQGLIADRTQEHLGRSDKGVIMFRRMLEEQIRIVEDGGDPINTFRDQDTNAYLGMDTEHWSKRAELAGGQAFAFERQGMASKYSPIMNERGVSGGVDAKTRTQEASR
ncbi:MAG: (2Fe-2S)-binding protein [Chloroflexi bacterium]|nr:(2Fe-2S)-binding protein [Chloroflexota bacterium]|tara:strand:- start:1723 stop:3081 length:1359 start_codon:yes stop_codon:yes gene_type:complete